MKLTKNHLYTIIIILFLFINYSNTFANDFAFDDYNFIVGVEEITSFRYIPAFFIEESWHNLWRPLRQVFYVVTYSIWGLNPFGYHLNAFVLHGIISLLVYLIIVKIVQQKEIALFTALLFVAHPIHTERVTNMTGSFDLLGILFYLLALYLFIQYRLTEQKKYYFLSLISYILGLLSSEEVITFMGISLLYDYCFTEHVRTNNIKKLIRTYLPFFLVTIIYVALHVIIVQQVGRTQTYFEGSFLITFLTSIKALVKYIQLLFFPFDLTIYRTLPLATSFLSIPFIISSAILLGIFSLTWAFRKHKLIFFSSAWFFVTMFLFYNFLPKTTFMADRYLYLPSLGYCLFLSLFIYKMKEISLFGSSRKLIMVFVFIMILSGYSYLTIARNMDWKDHETLIRKTVATSPLSTDAHWQMGEYYKEQKDYEQAIDQFQQAIELSSKNYLAYEELGVAYAELKQYSVAEQYFLQAIATFPVSEGGYYKAENNLGLLYYRMGNYSSAIHHLQKAIAIEPDFSKAHHDLGLVYATIGEYTKAEEELQRAIALNPNDATYRKNLQLLYQRRETKQ